MPINEIFLRPVEELPISVRTSYGLRNAEIKYVGELVQCTEEELLEIELRTQVAERGQDDPRGHWIVSWDEARQLAPRSPSN